MDERLAECWQKEFDEESWIRTSVVKLWRLFCFYIELLNNSVEVKWCHFDVWVDDKRGAYTIYINEFGFYREGPDSGTIFYKSDPITYEELINVLYEYDNPQKDRDVVQGFIKKFFTWGFSIPEELSAGVQDILRKAISAEEYAKIGEILEEDRKNAARGWLNKVEEFSKSSLYWRSTAEDYVKKAQSLWPDIDISGTMKTIEDAENKKDV